MTSIMSTLLTRLGGLVLTLVIASIVIYSAVLAAGDPIAALAGGAKPTPELVAQIRAEYHLDDPVWVRYWLWLTHAVQGDFGRSFVYNTDVAALIAPRLAITVQLVIFTVVLILLLGVGSGMVAALRGRAADTAVIIATSLGMALPTFVVAILLIWIFAKTLGWFPVFGEGAGGWDRVWHLALPSLSLAVLFSAYVSRVTRSSLVAQLGSEHVETARVRGISNGRIFRTHVLRNAAPQILAISGTTVAGLFAASAIAEVAFGIGGIGSLLVQAAARADLPVVQIISLLLVAIFVVLNAVADIVSAAIDPSSVAGGARA